MPSELGVKVIGTLLMGSGVSAVVAPVTDGLTKTERFDRAVLDAELPGVVFQRLTDDGHPETLSEIGRSMGFPRGRFVEWFMTEHGETYTAALKVLGGEIGHAVKVMVDGVTQETLGVVKLKTQRYLQLAGHWNPERYSPRTEVKHSGLVPTFVVQIVQDVSEGRLVSEVPEVVTPVSADAESALASPVVQKISATRDAHEMI